MYIGIDGSEANQKNKVGVNIYSYNLLWALYRLNNQKKVKDKFLIYLKSKKRDDLPKENKHFKYEVIEGKSFWIIKKLMPRLLLNRNIDVFFSPTHYLPIISGCPKVCTIHDLGYLKFSGQFKKYDFWQLKYWTAISLYISKYIISVSEYTKKDIVRHYPFSSKKIHIAYHGYDKSKYNLKVTDNLVRRVKKKYKTTDNYLIFIGTLKPSKNIEGLIKAFAKIKNDHPNYRLLICGKKGWLYETIFKLSKDLNVEDRVLFTGYIDEKDKPALIKGARAFLMPSFWEGFGIDLLSAMAVGTPIITSNISSIPEVVGDSAIFVDPENINDIAKAISLIIKLDTKGYNRIVEKGIRRVKGFSWEKTAKETLKVIKLAKKGNT